MPAHPKTADDYPVSQVMTAVEANRRWGIPAARIYRWVHRGMVRPVGLKGNRNAYVIKELRGLNRAANADARSTEFRKER